MGQKVWNMYEWMKWMGDVREGEGELRKDPSEEIEGATVHLVS